MSILPCASLAARLITARALAGLAVPTALGRNSGRAGNAPGDCRCGKCQPGAARGSCYPCRCGGPACPACAGLGAGPESLAALLEKA